MKIICAGLPKTGTKTMAAALGILGYRVHDFFEQFAIDYELFQKVKKNDASVDDFRKAFENVDAVTDFPACGLWEQLLEAFPDACVILMERTSETQWVQSVQRHCFEAGKFMPSGQSIPTKIYEDLMSGPMLKRMQRYFDDFLPLCIGISKLAGIQNESVLRSRYRQHNTYVKVTCPKEKLLVFNPSQGWGPLCTFLKVPIPDQPFPSENMKARLVKDFFVGSYDGDYGMYKAIKRETGTRLCFLLALIVGVLGWIVTYAFIL